jgi:hypothetical protein
MFIVVNDMLKQHVVHMFILFVKKSVKDRELLYKDECSCEWHAQATRECTVISHNLYMTLI